MIVGSGIIAYQAGLSMALGAFVAGLMLAETEYRKAIESTILIAYGQKIKSIERAGISASPA